MAFENSPGLQPHSARRVPFLTLVYQNQRMILITVGIVAVLGCLVIAVQLLPLFAAPPPTGGLDGCLATASGEPVVTMLQIDAVTRPSYADGCFFFPNLPAGQHELLIHTSAGSLSLPVTILPDQSTGLGTITITP